MARWTRIDGCSLEWNPTPLLSWIVYHIDLLLTIWTNDSPFLEFLVLHHRSKSNMKWMNVWMTKQKLPHSSKHSIGHPFAQMGEQWVASDKTHCEPSDWVKTNQWVCALTLWFVRITIESQIEQNGWKEQIHCNTSYFWWVGLMWCKSET